ncbi:phosphotransferase enzyme family protein [Streptomyces virginiae]|uniref:phosphotransferase enzyme family protein n=1 Tax=Streptomyces virginiae TaxID=1961 RepID=UPI0036619C5F
MVMKKPPRLAYFNFEESLLSQVAHDYSLADNIRFCPILLDGDHCTLIDVRSATSKKMVLESSGEWLFLKQIPWYCDDQTMDFALEWQVQLAGSGFSVPVVRQRRSGERVLRVTGNRLVLFDYVWGTRYQGRQDEQVAAAACLGRLHSLEGPSTGPHGDAFDTAADHIQLARELVGEAPSVSSALDRMQLLVDSWRDHATLHGWHNLPQRAVHGDFSPWNLVYHPDGQVEAVLDFDNAHLGPVIRDLVEALLTFCCVRYAHDSTSFATTPPDALPVKQATAMLRAYEAERPLTDEEHGCAPEVAGAVAVELGCLGLIRGDYSTDSIEQLISWAVEVRHDVERLFLSRPAIASMKDEGVAR